ncbi:MAG: acetate/propionate family kinase [Actinobacteria bacterium]|nr:acetate/propionate family kinase [Actinomycetota bacterium]MCL6104585.1 acetate/propionate family kinase [Actinomycetota bacterium]
MNILTINAGSSSIKCSLIGNDNALIAGVSLPAPNDVETEKQLINFIEGLPQINAIGHRIVHGGKRFTSPVVITGDIEDELYALFDIAPLHNPPALAIVKMLCGLYPSIPSVACFDTTFFVNMPKAASTYAVVQEWRDKFDIHRYGFHGLSHAYACAKAAELLGQPFEDLRLVSCHLGSGASLAAIANGQALDTTMGFTPLEGLVMATRVGSFDPGALLWVIRHGDLDLKAVEETLEHRSGLLALAGTAELKEIIKKANSNEPRAVLALSVYLHRLRSGIASMAASLGGLDVLIFTGGAGQASPQLRNDACAGLDFLGIILDPALNQTATDADKIVSSAKSNIAISVVQAREDIQIAQAVREVLH